MECPDCTVDCNLAALAAAYEKLRWPPPTSCKNCEQKKRRELRKVEGRERPRGCDKCGDLFTPATREQSLCGACSEVPPPLKMICTTCGGAYEYNSSQVKSFANLHLDPPTTCKACRPNNFINKQIAQAREKFAAFKAQQTVWNCLAVFERRYCILCGDLFVVTAQEAQFLLDHGWCLPFRCPGCRAECRNAQSEPSAIKVKT